LDTLGIAVCNQALYIQFGDWANPMFSYVQAKEESGGVAYWTL